MATTSNLGLTKLEVGQASKEATINANYDILDSAVSGGPTGAIWARATHNAVQSLPSGTLTAISLNTERWDTNLIHDTSTNNTRLTCKTAGVYSISAQLGFAANATGFRALGIRLGGATYIAYVQLPTAGASLDAQLAVTTVYRFAVNEYVEMLGFQNSGGALNTVQAGNHSPEFMMIRLGA